MLDGPIFSTMVRFAIPVLFSSIFQQLYNTMDTVIVGHTLGETALAAIGAATPAYDLLMGFALGIGSGLSIVTARSYGSKDEETLKKSVSGALVIGVVLTLILTLVTRIGLMPFLKLLNTPEDILPEAYEYSSCIMLFMGVTFAYNLCSGILRAVGDSVMPLIFLIISSVLNIVLDLWFIVGLGMGGTGDLGSVVYPVCPAFCPDVDSGETSFSSGWETVCRDADARRFHGADELSRLCRYCDPADGNQ